MYIEEFKEPINHLDNFVTAVKLCKLCSFDALSVSCSLDDNYQFYRYLNIDGLFIFFFRPKSKSHLYIVISSGTSLKSLQDYMSKEFIKTLYKLKNNILSVLDTLKEDVKLTTYCVGHSAAGVLAFQLANDLSLKAITLGQLPLTVDTIISIDKKDCVLFTTTADLLCIQSSPYITKIKTTPSYSTLEGVVNHSIDSYMNIINKYYPQDLEVELELTHYPEETLVS